MEHVTQIYYIIIAALAVISLWKIAFHAREIQKSTESVKRHLSRVETKRFFLEQTAEYLGLSEPAQYNTLMTSNPRSYKYTEEYIS